MIVKINLRVKWLLNLTAIKITNQRKIKKLINNKIFVKTILNKKIKIILITTIIMNY